MGVHVTRTLCLIAKVATIIGLLLWSGKAF
jgi:hypothetical protein